MQALAEPGVKLSWVEQRNSLKKLTEKQVYLTKERFKQIRFYILSSKTTN
jgi:hypothetical protein